MIDIKEMWKEIEDFEGYEVSNKGQIRTYWEKKHKEKDCGFDYVLGKKPKILKTSDDGNGYLKLMLYNRQNKKRYCKKVHRLVAEAFVSGRSEENNTVDHIKSGADGKLDNSVNNLRWVSRRKNIQKAYRDHIHDERIRKSRKMILVHDEVEGEVYYFPSIEDASRYIHVDRSSVSHNIHNNIPELLKRRYWVEEIEGEDRLLYDDEYYSEQFSRV